MNEVKGVLGKDSDVGGFGSVTIEAGIAISGTTTDSPKLTCAKVVLAEAKRIIEDAMVITTSGFRNDLATVGPPLHIQI